VIMACELYCCLLPQCEALRTCHSGFPIATPSIVVWVVGNLYVAWDLVCYVLQTCLRVLPGMRRGPNGIYAVRPDIH